MEHMVLFTGGLDSSYRLCQLAQDEKAVVQPVYILFPDDGKNQHVRSEMQREIDAQDKILDYIVSHPNTKAKFLPIKRIDCCDLRFAGMAKWEKILAKAYLGYQYLYCSSYARLNKGVEICQEKFPPGYYKRNHGDYRKCILKFDKDGFGRTLVKPKEDSPLWAQQYVSFIWSDMTYPVFGVTRQQMKKDLITWGYDGIWDFIWFCYKAIDNKPCGVCDNCVDKIDGGLVELFDNNAMRRFYILKIIAVDLNDDLSKFYRFNIYKGEDEFLSSLVLSNFKGWFDPSGYHWIRGIKRLFSMDFRKLKRLYEKHVREVKK